ncbi:PA2778 family cysteine peptidase [Desulfovermiculus halophilus]|uniref:PA2778 family cysteine peptidase n=1 Tax=Desulfovermiculus halophilus TaxID=339722 RepID=UPI0013786FAA|nr:PA2778 family cysteine peptidase [Desulfovermiculus halophilus]
MSAGTGRPRPAAFTSLVCAGLLIACLGCASHTPLPGEGMPPPDMEAVSIAGVPAYAQQEHRCGAAALASVLTWSRVRVSSQNIGTQVHNPQRDGTLQAALISSARRNRRVAYPIHGPKALILELKAGHPVLVLVNRGLSWWPAWHYSVVCGYRSDPGEVLMARGTPVKEWVPWTAFLRTWQRADFWGLLVLRPDDLPATVEADSWARSVHGLELAAHHRLALTGYTAALTRWPTHLAAMMGRANCFYALGRLKLSEAALRRAAALHPDSGPVHNNLAHILLKQGKLQAADEAINAALRLGKPHPPAYEQTREAIRRARDSRAH